MFSRVCMQWLPDSTLHFELNLSTVRPTSGWDVVLPIETLLGLRSIVLVKGSSHQTKPCI